MKVKRTASSISPFPYKIYFSISIGLLIVFSITALNFFRIPQSKNPRISQGTNSHTKAALIPPISYRNGIPKLNLLFDTSATDGCPVADSEVALDSEEQEFTVLINQYRQSHGLQPLKLSLTLTKMAAWKSHDMAVNNYFDHNDVPTGRTALARFQACGYTSPSLAENIAAGHETAQDTMTQWQNSPEHNANMLDPNMVVHGVARYFSATSTNSWYWTDSFGGVDLGDNVVPTVASQSTQTVTPTTASWGTQGFHDCTVSDSEIAISPEEQVFVNLVNTYRQQNGLQPLKLSLSLTRASAWKAHDMSVNNYYTHNDLSGRDTFTRNMDCGYPSNLTGENQDVGFADAQHTFDALKADAPHNQNMLDPRYVVMGVARYPSPSYNYFWVNDFGEVDAGDDTVPQGPDLPSPTQTTHPTPTVLNMTPTTSSGTQPTSTLWISPTPSTQSGMTTTFVLTARILGIGNSVGDNSFPNHPKRNVEISLADSNNPNTPIIGVGDGIMSYQAGIFTGSISITSSISKNSYLISIIGDSIPSQPISKTPIAVIPGGTVNLPSVQLGIGDLNQDKKMDLLDYNLLVGCYGNKLCKQKMLADLNDDGIVDELDVNIFLHGLALLQ